MMFVVMIRYKASLDLIDQYLKEHRDYLETGYQKNILITSGPQKPRTGGILLSQAKEAAVLNEFLESDPFKLRDLIEYEVIEFDPVKYHDKFAVFIS